MKRTIQLGKENQRGPSRSNPRKLIKSPFRIRDKIKELQQQQQLHDKRDTHSKGKINNKHDKPMPIDSKNYGVVSYPMEKPLLCLQRDKEYPFLSRNSVSPQHSAHKLPANLPKTVRTSTSPPASRRTISSIGNHRMALKMAISSAESIENDQLIQLKEENLRYKRIYSHSLEKMEQLQSKLQAIKQQNEVEKDQLESTMQRLRERIAQKKLSLCHLFTPADRPCLLQECIITEVENEASSILEISSRFHRPSQLSMDSP